MVDLNSAQKTAVHHRDGPLLVLAGAGSGKTRIVTERIIHLIESGVAPESILAMTFTNKAAGEMAERVRHRTAANVLICTFHSLGVRILREKGEVLGLPKNFTIYDEEDVLKILRPMVEDPKVARQQISQLKNGLKEDAILEPYTKKLRECGAVDFDDLLVLPVKLFREHPEVLAEYQQRWRYLLIDEYQDTNAAQYSLAKMLSKESLNLFAVGDPDQSIYSWRGANIRNILHFQQDFPGAPIVRLEQNYRSRSNILEAANAVIRNNEGRLEKNLWSERGEGPKVRLYIADDEHDEAYFVVRQIEDARRQGSRLSEMVIFYRTNFQSRTFEDALLRRKIPYVIVGGVSFYQRKEIKDVLAYLRLISNPTDIVSFWRTINLPKRGFGEASLEKITAWAGEQQLPIVHALARIVSGEGIKLSAKQKSGLQEYVEVLTQLRVLAQTLSVGDIVAETVKRSGIREALEEDPETADDRKENVSELVTKASEWEGSLEAFLEELSLKSQLDEADMSTEKVSLMTIHNGKGLEFNYAFLVGLEEELFPHANSRSSPEGIEEERRLCYVGMTRAKEQLTLCASRTRKLWGTFRVMRPSRFCSEIPKHFLQVVPSTRRYSD